MSEAVTLLIDAHVHLYPGYDLDRAFRKGVENLIQGFERPGGRIPPDTVAVWLLTERHDCRFFDEITESPDVFGRPDREVRMGREPGAVLIRQKDLPDLYLLAGRQFVSKEGLEVLALTGWEKYPERSYSTADLIGKIRACGAAPVLNWAPGKWFFTRGRVVRRLIRKAELSDFLIGDTPLRHVLWPRPGLMRLAVRKGLRTAAGSDPLPFKGEEFMIGTYGNTARGAFDPKKPVTSVRRILNDPETLLRIIGQRNDPFRFVWREARILLK